MLLRISHFTSDWDLSVQKEWTNRQNFLRTWPVTVVLSSPLQQVDWICCFACKETPHQQQQSRHLHKCGNLSPSLRERCYLRTLHDLNTFEANGHGVGVLVRHDCAQSCSLAIQNLTPLEASDNTCHKFVAAKIGFYDPCPPTPPLLSSGLGTTKPKLHLIHYTPPRLREWSYACGHWGTQVSMA